MKNLNILSLNHTGDGIGRLDGKVIFVPKSIPGDIVDVKVVYDHKTYCRGIIDKIIKGSDDRVSVKCPYYDICGGCQIMGLDYFKQLDYKKNKVMDILKKYGDIDIDIDIIPSSNIYEYRNKITLQVVNGKMGLYKYNSNVLVSIDRCLLVSNNVNRLISVIKDNLDLISVSKIMIREYDNSLMVQFIGSIYEDSVVKVLSGIVSSIYINDKCIFGQKNLEVRLGDYSFRVSPYSFFQVNYDQTLKLYNKVKEYLGSNLGRVLDLYCGTGTIGIYVSENCREVVGIEINESSVRDARDNIKLNKVDNVRIIKGDVGSVLDDEKRYDAIIVDPPRSGLDKRTKKTLLNIKSESIIYVSCDPITLARDLKVLSESYEIKDMVLVDMFPNTYHCESVVVLEKIDD